MTLFALTYILWAALHSVLAAAATKSWIRRRFGAQAYDGLYRLFYNLLATITFVPVLYLLATRVSSEPVWDIPAPFSLIANLIRLGGLVGLTISLWQTDIWDFAGIKQAARYLTKRSGPVPVPEMVTSGSYALVRHPLYFFSLVLIWFNPNMTLNVLLFNLLSTLYFVLGAYHEERRLGRSFGHSYEAYRQSVPFLLPVKLRLPQGD
jgi:protein-S-isoprenylcysteine O-methyltransferase Ste14